MPAGWSMIGSCTEDSQALIEVGIIRALFRFEYKYEYVGSGNNVGPLPSGEGFWINLTDPGILTVTSQ